MTLHVSVIQELLPACRPQLTGPCCDRDANNCPGVDLSIERTGLFASDEVGLKLGGSSRRHGLCRSRFQGSRHRGLARSWDARSGRRNREGCSGLLEKQSELHLIGSRLVGKNMRCRIGRHDFANGVAHNISRFVRLSCFAMNGRKTQPG